MADKKLDSKPLDKTEVKKIKDFLKSKSKLSSAKADAISDNETDRKKLTRTILREHGLSEEHLNKLKL